MNHPTDGASSLPELPEPMEIDWPSLNPHALGCGVEDRDLHNRYECAEYGWLDGVDRAAACVPAELYTADQMQAYAHAALAALPQAPAYNRAREMADEVFAELDATTGGWSDEDMDRISGTLLPRVYDCLNLLAMASGTPQAPGGALTEEARLISKVAATLERAGETPEDALRMATESVAAPQEVPAVAVQAEPVQAWVNAYRAYLEAVDAYNTRLAAIREREQRFPEDFGRDNPQSEWQAWHEAERKARALVMPMYEALAAHPEPAAPAETNFGERCAPTLAQHNGVKTHDRRTEEGSSGSGEEGSSGREAARGNAAGTSSVERGAGARDAEAQRDVDARDFLAFAREFCSVTETPSGNLEWHFDGEDMQALAIEVTRREPAAPSEGARPCALCGSNARIPPTCDACHDSMGTKPKPAAPSAVQEVSDDALVDLWRSQTNHINNGDLLNGDALAFARAILALRPAQPVGAAPVAGGALGLIESHPNYVAGFKAGHAAGKSRSAPVRAVEQPTTVRPFAEVAATAIPGRYFTCLAAAGIDPPPIGTKVYLAAPKEAQPAPVRKELTSKQIRDGWENTFSTNNPFCPCDLKSFTKAVNWAERALTAASKGEQA